MRLWGLTCACVVVRAPAHLSTVSANTNTKCDSSLLQFGLLTDVTMLNLGINAFTGTTPTEIGRLTKLTSGSGFDGFLATNQLVGEAPTQLGLLTDFERYFFISKNQFTGSLPSELGSLTKMTSVYAVDGEFDSTLPTQIGRLSKMRYCLKAR